MNSRKNILICAILISAAIAVSVNIAHESPVSDSPVVFSPDLTLKQLADKNSIPLKEILHILSHNDPSVWDADRGQPVNIIMRDPSAVKKAIEHIKEETSPFRDIAKYTAWAVYLCVILLAVLNRRRIGRIRVAAMAVALLLFGIVSGATPNPMESLVKLFKVFNNMEGSPRIIISGFILFTLFSIAGSKLICSWGCPLGALQESLFNIPGFRRKYALKVPFALSISVRMTVFIVFLVLFFGLGYWTVAGIRNFVIYHHLNFFKIFNFHELAAVAFYALPVFAIANFFLFRPFCHYICPFGLYSWILENAALNRIRINEKKCIKCGKCVAACPTEAMKHILGHKRQSCLPDCWSCGKCIDACPVSAIEYK